MAVSQTRKALRSLKRKVSYKNLPATKLARLREVTRRRTLVRNALMYKEWLDADNKELVIKKLVECWGYKRHSAVRKIIEDQRKKGVAVARYASNIEAIRQVRAAQVAADNDVAQSELDNYLESLYALRESGEHFAIQEITEREGDKESTTTITIPIQQAINQALTLKNRFYESEAKAMANFEGVPANQRFLKGTAKLTIEADAEFMSEFARLQGLANKPKPLDQQEIR